MRGKFARVRAAARTSTPLHNGVELGSGTISLSLPGFLRGPEPGRVRASLRRGRENAARQHLERPNRSDPSLDTSVRAEVAIVEDAALVAEKHELESPPGNEDPRAD